MSHFFIPPSSIQEKEAVVSGGEVHHIFKTRRMKIGDEIKFTDGVGHQYRGKLLETGRPSVHIEILEKSERKPLSPFAMALPLIEFGRLEWALEKCVELGCAEFWFINTDRTQFTLRFETAERKRLRWHRIALEATKQSENCYVPDIQQVLALPELLNQWKGDCVAFHGSTGPASLLPQTRQQTRSGQKVPGTFCQKGNGLYFSSVPRGAGRRKSWRSLKRKKFRSFHWDLQFFAPKPPQSSPSPFANITSHKTSYVTVLL